jgi:hypothetical protein
VSLWFKIHDDALDDPRLQRLAPATFRAWFNLLCVASRNGGRLPELPELAWLLRCGRKPLARRLEELKAAGLVEEVDGALRPVDWQSRQTLRETGDEPLSGAERSRRWRERRDAAVTPSRDEETSQRDAPAAREREEDLEADSQSAPAARASDRFDEFWSAFPKRGGGEDAEAPTRDAFRKAIGKGADPAAIVAAAKAYAASCAGREPRFIASASRWLSEERWRATGHAKPSAESPGVWIKAGSPEWASWTAHRGKSPPIDGRGGWRFPSRLPPDAAPLAA